MSWTTPTVRATGYLVTSSDWNTDLVDNLAFLKGEAGEDIDFEDDIIGKAGSERVGLSSAPWAEGHFDKLFAGPRASLHKFIREVVITWENNAISDVQVDDTSTGAGSNGSMGGSGQAVLVADDSQVGTHRFSNLVEQNNALDTSFNVGRNPYIRMELAIDGNNADTEAFLGFRTTIGNARPLPAAESYAGIMWTGAQWYFECGDGGGGQDTSAPQTINVNTRYVIEILIVSATSVEVYLNGVLVDTFITGLPTGDLDWTQLLISGGGGGGTDVHLTVGEIIIQEDLS